MTPTTWQRILASFVGLTENDQGYQDRLFYSDRPKWRPAAARDLYSCGLTARAALEEGGAAMGERLPLPYEGRNTVISDLVAQARAVGAYLPVTFENCAKPARILIIGRNQDPSWGLPASEHVVCVHLADVQRENKAARLATVEGGQRNAQGVDSIGGFERALYVGVGGHLWLGAPGSVGRRVGHVIAVDLWPTMRRH